MQLIEKISEHLSIIYQDQTEQITTARQLFQKLIQEYEKKSFPNIQPINEKNVYLITYGDAVYRSDEHPLVTLNQTLSTLVPNEITDVHILPMFPYTSDDGFAVTDYEKINPELGNWQDIQTFSQSFRLMFDFVANHTSKSNPWFQNFLNNEPEFKESFITFSDDFDSSQVVRPRTSPLFHEYPTPSGSTKKVWTTFSEDQVDVNVQDPHMLIRLTKVLLDYTRKDASSIRLDAIGFLWKTSGTTCMHLPQTHEVIKLWRTLLETWAPNTQIITETNVPHDENISYFGNTQNEAHQVYQFTLPPLVLHTFTQNNSSKLSQWAKNIHKISDQATFFNFLASHDGIGMRPIEGILKEEEKQLLIEKTIKNGGKVSYKLNPDGSQTVYELNINYSEALRNPKEDEQTVIKKMLAAHHILLSFLGVPAIYYHSLFGSKNDEEGLKKSGINRRINREKLPANQLITEINSSPYRNQIFHGLKQLIQIRQKYAQFSPYAEQEVMDFGPNIFSLKRIDDHSKNEILTLTNVTNQSVHLSNLFGNELISDTIVTGELTLPPYGYAWIEVDNT